ncbi:MAG TPA: hypothetical protein VKZ75_02395, partial [Cyclobacteriaceae bacterium]|nr:hypothetical protein [Cyclobacteriaceae bacterium]
MWKDKSLWNRGLKRLHLRPCFRHIMGGCGQIIFEILFGGQNTVSFFTFAVHFSEIAMYAIVDIAGKQYKVVKDQYIYAPRLA